MSAYFRRLGAFQTNNIIVSAVLPGFWYWPSSQTGKPPTVDQSTCIDGSPCHHPVISTRLSRSRCVGSHPWILKSPTGFPRDQPQLVCGRSNFHSWGVLSFCGSLWPTFAAASNIHRSQQRILGQMKGLLDREVTTLSGNTLRRQGGEISSGAVHRRNEQGASNSSIRTAEMVPADN